MPLQAPVNEDIQLKELKRYLDDRKDDEQLLIDKAANDLSDHYKLHSHPGALLVLRSLVESLMPILYETKANEVIHGIKGFVPRFRRFVSLELKMTSRSILFAGIIADQLAQAYDTPNLVAAIRRLRNQPDTDATLDRVLDEFANLSQETDANLHAADEHYLFKSLEQALRDTLIYLAISSKGPNESNRKDVPLVQLVEVFLEKYPMVRRFDNRCDSKALNHVLASIGERDPVYCSSQLVVASNSDNAPTIMQLWSNITRELSVRVESRARKLRIAINTNCRTSVAENLTTREQEIYFAALRSVLNQSVPKYPVWRRGVEQLTQASLSVTRWTK